MADTARPEPKLAAVPREITWTNNLLIMAGAKADEAREFYLRTAIRDRLSSRELERQIDSMLFERTMLSDNAPVRPLGGGTWFISVSQGLPGRGW